MKTKVTYILANIDKAIAFEWITAKINQSKFELSFIILNATDSYLYNWLQEKNIESYLIYHYGKKSYPKTFFKVIKLLKKISPEIVHTHLFDANLIGLTAAKFLGIKKRIYTRHHSTFHHEFFPKAVKYDKWSNKMATDIVAISKNVRNVLVELEKVPLYKITLIHHGFDLDKFITVPQDEVLKLRKKHNLTSVDKPIIGVIARHINWKGHVYLIKAFKKLLKKYPNAKLMLADTSGPNKTEIQQLLQKGLTPTQFVEITFEPNLFALYKLFDIYVHVPINNKIEAFGQTYVEALASGIPSIFTLSGIAHEFVEHKKNALVVDYQNSEDIYRSFIELLNNKTLAQQIAANGLKSVEQFNLNLFIHKLEKLYKKS